MSHRESRDHLFIWHQKNKKKPMTQQSCAQVNILSVNFQDISTFPLAEMKSVQSPDPAGSTNVEVSQIIDI